MSTSSARVALTIALVGASALGCAATNAHVDPSLTPIVTADDIERNSGRPLEEVLQAKVPGLLVRRTTDGGVSVEMRGPASFTGNSDPLYVIDDTPFQPGPLGALTGINPHDIESIRVLKNPADIAIYGMRGANGVIVVQTKRPGTAHHEQ